MKTEEWNIMHTILIEYKASEIALIDALHRIDKIIEDGRKKQ